MKNIILTGSTGMIGRLVLEKCLDHPSVNSITSISRKTSGIKNARLTELIHQDFLDFTPIESHFKNQDVCFFCIGVYTGQVPPPEFKKITVDYTRAFAETLKRNSPQASFCFLSGQGADRSEKSRILFAREKGIAENILFSLQFPNTYIFRPGYIYPETPRTEPNVFYRIMRRLYKPVSFLYPNIGVSSIKLATKMVEVGLNGGKQMIYENAEIRE
ncbi:MAG: NAD-dependent epimerase/dehydratase family protein [Flavisolibacter sp.]